MTPEDYAELMRLRAEAKAPEGFATWRAVAQAERSRSEWLEVRLKIVQGAVDELLAKQETLIEYLKGANDIINKLLKVVNDDLR